jgi:hypothetical protein
MHTEISPPQFDSDLPSSEIGALLHEVIQHTYSIPKIQSNKISARLRCAPHLHFVGLFQSVVPAGAPVRLGGPAIVEPYAGNLRFHFYFVLALTLPINISNPKYLRSRVIEYRFDSGSITPVRNFIKHNDVSSIIRATCEPFRLNSCLFSFFINLCKEMTVASPLLSGGMGEGISRNSGVENHTRRTAPARS